MPRNFESGFSPENVSEEKKRQTPERLRTGVDKIIKLFCKEFSVDGKEQIARELAENPDAKFVIAASHISNLDAPAAVEALGDILNIQITAESVLFEGAAPQRALFALAGKENFTPLSYEKEKKGKHAVFDPDDFTKLTSQVEEGKTPWIAIHPFWTARPPFTRTTDMGTARIGSVYLAHKARAKIIPTAFEYHGGSVDIEGPGETAKALVGRAKGEGKGVYHVGSPIELRALDVSIIETVTQKRGRGEKVTSEEKHQFSEVLQRLREDAETVARKIGSMLPEEHRGQYVDTAEIQLDEHDLETVE